MRTLFAAVLSLVLVLAPTGAFAATETDRNSDGTARSTLDLLRIEVELPGALGELVSSLTDLSLAAGGGTLASIDRDPARNTLGGGTPFAQALLRLPVVGEIGVRSDGTNRHPATQVDLPAGVGSLSLAGLEALADDASAQALLDLLSSQVELAIGGINAGTLEGWAAQVDTDDALAQTGAVVEDLRIGLGDLLPAELLSLLPLEALLELVESLPVDGSALQQLQDQLSEIRSAVTALTVTRTAAAGVVDELASVLAPLDEALATGSGLDQAELTALVAELEPLLADLDDLTAQLTDDLGGLLDLIDGLGGLDLVGLLQQVVDGLAGLELVAVDELVAGVNAAATATTSEAGVDCRLSGVSILGVAAPNVTTCPQLRDALTQVTDTVTGALDALPLASVLPTDVVGIDGLVSRSTEDGAREGAYQTASASLTALELEVRSVSLASLVDQLVTGLLGELDGLLELLGGDLTAALDGTVAEDADLVALLEALLSEGLPGFDGGLADLIDALGAVEDTTGTGDLTDDVRNVLQDLAATGVSADIVGLDAAIDVIEDLLAALDALPTGDLLGGLATPSVRVAVLDLASVAEFTAASTNPTPVSVPAQPAPTPLPRTGGDAAWPLVGLMLAMVGAWGLRSRLQRPAATVADQGRNSG